jgi:hypothetical protein
LKKFNIFKKRVPKDCIWAFFLERISNMKHCYVCNEWKEENNFCKDKQRRDGLNPVCKLCVKKDHKARYNAQEKRDYQLRYLYNITQEDWNILFEKQNGCCAICGKHQSILSQTLHLDHNHINGKTRGLLCFDCNTKLGKVEKGIYIRVRDFQQRALSYLRIYE